MAFEVQQLEPAAAREPMVDFLWEQKHWPWQSREEYATAWDWRYSALSDGEPRVWLARQEGAVVGQIAVYFRRYRLGGQELRVGVPGNLLVRKDLRDTMIGPRLVNLPRTLVRKGEADLILAYGNAAAHSMFLRLGFKDLGAMQHYADVRRAGPALGRRLRVAAAAGPLVDAGFGARRWWRRRALRPTRPLEVRPIAPADTSTIDRGSWRQDPAALVADDQPEFVSRRFIECPHAPRRLFGLFDRQDGSLHGYVVAEGDNRLKIWDCQVNEAVLSEPEAVARVVDSLSGVETVLVPLLPTSRVAQRFRDAGYLERVAEDYVEAHTWWSAYWQDNHPLAEQLSRTELWRLWFGANHY